MESQTSLSGASGQNKFKIHIRNEAGEDVRFQQKQEGSDTDWKTGPVVDVPNRAMASVDYVDKDNTGKLTFEVVGKDNGKSFMLNGQKEFVVDEKNLNQAGQYVVVHKAGQDWKKYLNEMTTSTTGGISGGMTSSSSESASGMTTLGGSNSSLSLIHI